MFFKPREKIICTVLYWAVLAGCYIPFHLLICCPEPGWCGVCNVISVKHYQCDEHHSPGPPRHSRLHHSRHASQKFCPKTRTGLCFYPGSQPGQCCNDRDLRPARLRSCSTRALPGQARTPLSTAGQISHKPNVDGVGLPISQIIPEIHHLLASLLEF